MCDLKSFSFSHHFGSGFKYFSATIIRKLSKILNLRLSGGVRKGGGGRRQVYLPHRSRDLVDGFSRVKSK